MSKQKKPSNKNFSFEQRLTVNLTSVAGASFKNKSADTKHTFIKSKTKKKRQTKSEPQQHYAKRR